MWLQSRFDNPILACVALVALERVAAPSSGLEKIAKDLPMKTPSRLPCPLCARSRHQYYSITASGIVRPSALAVLRLMTSSNLVGSGTGTTSNTASPSAADVAEGCFQLIEAIGDRLLQLPSAHCAKKQER